MTKDGPTALINLEYYKAKTMHETKTFIFYCITVSHTFCG